MNNTMKLVSCTVMLSALALGCGGGDETSPASTEGSGGAGGEGTGGQGTGGAGNGGAGMGGAGMGGAGTGGEGSVGSRWVMGYYVGYQVNLYPPEAIDFKNLTHLAVGRVTPQQDGSLGTTFDIDPVSGPALAKQLTTLTHNAGKKAILMVGGAGEYWGWVGAASDANRATFVKNLVDFMDEHGFDGLDIDWEPIEAQDQAPLKALAEELRAAKPGILLTLPVGWVSSNFPEVGSFYSEIAPLFDQINIMSYYMADAWPGWSTWHSSPLYGESPTTPSSIASSVKAYVDAGMPAGKLGVGLGFYGACWAGGVTEPKTDPGGSSIVADDNLMSFTNIMSSYYEPQARKWDDVAKVPYLSYPSAKGQHGCTFISYEDEQSIQEKGAFVKQEGLGGVIIWTINQGHLPNAPAGERDPLLAATMQSLAD